MKTKILSLIFASAFALVLLASFVAAGTLADWELTTDGVAINVDTNVNAGTFGSDGVTFNDFDATDGIGAEDWPTAATADTAKYYEVTISPKADYDLTITDINFDYSGSAAGPATFDLQYSKEAGFASPTSLVIEDDVSTTEETSSNSGLTIAVAEGETLTLRWFGYDFTTITNEFYMKDLTILGTANAVPTVDPITCPVDEGNLRVDINDIQVIKGFGDDDDYWYIMDEIEVEFEIENTNNDEKIKDIK